MQEAGNLNQKAKSKWQKLWNRFRLRPDGATPDEPKNGNGNPNQKAKGKR